MVSTKKIALIGAGPIGIEMAIALKRASVDYSHFEAGTLAETISNYPEDTTFFSSPGRIEIAGYAFDVYPNLKATKEQYLAYLRSIVRTEKLEIRYQSKVVELEKLTSGLFDLCIRKQSGNSDYNIQAENLILAIGDMHGPNLLDVSGEDLPHVTHQLKELHTYFGLNVLVVGGKNSAIEAAIRLARIGAKVTLSYRGPELISKKIKPWILPDFDSLVREGEIKFLPSSEVTSIETSAVKLKQNGKEIECKFERVLLLTGYLQDQDLFRQADVKLVEKGRVGRKVLYQPEYEAESMQAAPGVFIIGTAVSGSSISKTTEFIETSHVHIPRVLKKLGLPCLIPITDAPVRKEEDREL
jgi:thioredoxin reductase (NADPH)